MMFCKLFLTIILILISEGSNVMSWTEKMKEFGGGDLAFLSEDGEAIRFMVCGDPVLLEGGFMRRMTITIGLPRVRASVA